MTPNSRDEAKLIDTGFQPFPVNSLPFVLRALVNEGASAIGCDTSYIALPVLTALAAAIGSTYQLEIKPGWYAKSILWSAVVGESGTAKTPAFNLILKPMHSFQNKCFAAHAKEMEKYAIAMKYHERSMKQWTSKRQSLGDDPPILPPAPQAERVIVDDPTIEALAPILVANPRGLLLAKDELSGWFGSFNRYSTGKGNAEESRYLSMYNGLPFTVDRKTGQPPTIHVPQAYLSICGGIQPGVLERSWGQAQRESGLAARFLIAYPPRKAKVYSEAVVDSGTEKNWALLVEKLLSQHHHQNEVVTLRLSPEAYSRKISWLNQHYQEQAAVVGDMAAAFSKLEEIAFRLAIGLHLACYFSNEVVPHNEVDQVTMESAIILTEWFKNEARRIYKLFGCNVNLSQKQSLLKWLKERGEPVTPRDAQIHLRDYKPKGGSERARIDLDALVSDGLCKRDQQGKYLPTRQHANNSVGDSVGVGIVGTASDLPQVFSQGEQRMRPMNPSLRDGAWHPTMGQQSP